jgi:putative flippase GtrA
MKRILKQFFQREAHPVVQFIKYGLAGGLATVVDVLVFYFLSWKVFPALTADDAVVKLLGMSIAEIDEITRSRHYLLNKTITFFFSNLTAYIVNILWVFKPGRHKKWVEFALFYAVSIVSFSLGTFLGWFVIAVLGLTTTAAYVANLFASLMINYACRKYWVFKG